MPHVTGRKALSEMEFSIDGAAGQIPAAEQRPRNHLGCSAEVAVPRRFTASAYRGWTMPGKSWSALLHL
jgi:hypothetical protein